MLTGVIYARYSAGPEQTEMSIEGQVDDCKAYAKEKKIRIIKVYADRHISGKSTVGREAFLSMMAAAEKHAFDCIITWKIDRIGRSREDLALCKIKLKKAGVKLLYAKESVPDGPEGILLESLLEGLAEYYSADLKQKVLRGLREKAKKGIYPCGSLPVGYLKDKKTGKIILDEKKAPAIRRAFQEFAAGRQQGEILHELYLAGVYSKDGGTPARATLYRMLRNPRYKGEFEWDGIQIPAPAIVSDELFSAVQIKAPDRAHNAAGKAKVDLLLSCRCHCAYCGKMLIGDCGTGKSGKVYHYYSCQSKKHKTNCKLISIKQKDLEDTVISHTRKDVLSGKMVEYIADQIMNIQNKLKAKDPIIAERNKLEAIHKKQDRLVKAIEDGGEIVSLAKRLKELEQEADEISLEITKMEMERPYFSRDEVIAWLKSFKINIQKDPAARKRLAQVFIKDVIVSNDTITVLYNSFPERRGIPRRCSNTVSPVDYLFSYSNNGSNRSLTAFTAVLDSGEIAVEFNRLDVISGARADLHYKITE